MTRLVSVRYEVPVFCTVDLDAKMPEGDAWYSDDAVTRVFQADESIMLADDPITDAVEADEEDQVDPDSLTAEERELAILIANSTVWPAWDR